MPRKPYPSDVTDDEWALLEPLIPPHQTVYEDFADWRKRDL